MWLRFMQSLLAIKPIRIDEAPPEAEVGLLAAFMTVAKRSPWEQLTRRSRRNLSLEVYSSNQQTGFVLGVPHGLESYFSSQLLSHHSQLFVQKNAPDPVTYYVGNAICGNGRVKLSGRFNLAN
jgi:hypothetical protein